MMRRILMVCCLLAALGVHAERCVREWTFETPAKVAAWTQSMSHVENVRCEDGVMKGTIANWDPWVTSPIVDVPTSIFQYLEIELKTNLAGSGQIFYTDTDKSKFNGFFSDKFVSFGLKADSEWHTYKVTPYWPLAKLRKFRLDLATTHDRAKHGVSTFEVRRIRLMDPEMEKGRPVTPNWTFTGTAAGWQASEDTRATVGAEGLTLTPTGAAPVSMGIGNILTDIGDHGCWVVVELAATKATSARLSWLTGVSRGERSLEFEIQGDGVMRHYNLDLSAQSSWDGPLYALRLGLSEERSGSLTVRRMWVSDEPGGPVSLVASHAGLTNAINRAGMVRPFSFRLHNRGGETARGLRITDVSLPEGVTVVRDGRYPLEPVDIPGDDRWIATFNVRAERPVRGPFAVTMAHSGGETFRVTGELEFTAPLGLPKADYVPAPQPPESDYEVGALYFPGWGRARHWGWQPIYERCPERKPVLGWFDEADPACVDWQIKWLTENGIQYLLVDWYWHMGKVSLEHWIQAYRKARYRSHLKWAMMWANHNPPGSHSVEDMEAVTRYWIDNYFNMPEYYKIDGKPVVMIWSVSNMDRDVPDGGSKRLLEVSQRIAREAGLPGIHFSAMKWPETVVTEPQIRALADKGFESTSIYHYMGHGGKAKNPARFSFELVAETNRDLWEKWHEVGILPFFLNLSTGWDDRPWRNHCEIYGRTPELFRRICQDAKAFADRTGLKKRILLSPINEWGEGSYAEPNREFGFGMYEAVRDTFCKKPAGGWPLNYSPEDIGLPVFDDPAVEEGQSLRRTSRTSWDFSDGTQSWQPLMGVSPLTAKDGVLSFVTTSADPALSVKLGKLRARRFSRLVLRMRVSPVPADGKEDKVQLFWEKARTSANEAMSISIPVVADGQFHDYEFNLGAHKRYSGFLTMFRLDPLSRKGAKVEIASVELK